MESLKLKNAISEVKNSLDQLNNRMEMTEERISECEGRAIEITQLEKQREKRLTKNEQSFRHL